MAPRSVEGRHAGRTARSSATCFCPVRAWAARRAVVAL